MPRKLCHGKPCHARLARRFRRPAVLSTADERGHGDHAHAREISAEGLLRGPAWRATVINSGTIALRRENMKERSSLSQRSLRRAVVTSTEPISPSAASPRPRVFMAVARDNERDSISVVFRRSRAPRINGGYLKVRSGPRSDSRSNDSSDGTPRNQTLGSEPEFFAPPG